MHCMSARGNLNGGSADVKAKGVWPAVTFPDTMRWANRPARVADFALPVLWNIIGKIFTAPAHVSRHIRIYGGTLYEEAGTIGLLECYDRWRRHAVTDLKGGELTVLIGEKR